MCAANLVGVRVVPRGSGDSGGVYVMIGEGGKRERNGRRIMDR